MKMKNEKKIIACTILIPLLLSDIQSIIITMASGRRSTVVEHLPHPPKVKGSCPAVAAYTGRENMSESNK
jgi:hypothetical protein